MLLLTVTLLAPRLAVSSPVAPQAASPPTLLLLVAVDQMRADYLSRFADQFRGGFRMLLDEGAVFTDAHQAHAITATAPGHASMLSGVYPRRHGIIDNSWRDRDTGRAERAASDRDFAVVGLDPGSDTAGPAGSPRQFHGSSLIGWLRWQHEGVQAVSISRKERTAVLAAPEAEHVYWFHGSGRFVTSTYYRDALPDWMRRFNATDWLSEYAGASWTLLEAEALYAASRPDDYLGEARLRGFGVSFPHTLPTDRRALGSLITMTPFMDQATLDAAREAIVGLELGADAAPDVLAVGLSSTDAVGHAFGPYSREMQDQLLRLDLELADFFEFVDATVGLERVLIALTADHGVAPLPEYTRSRAQDAQRIDLRALRRDLNAHVSSRFGEGRWFSSYSYGWLHLDRALSDELGADPDAVVVEAERYLEARPEVAAAYTRAELESGRSPQTDLEQRVHRAYVPSRSGDIYIIHPPFSIWQAGSATNHQSPYFYDSHVPLILRGPGVRPGTYPGRVQIVDLAPTLAALFGVDPAGELDGRVLLEALLR